VSPKYNAIELVFLIYKLLNYYHALGHPIKLGGGLTVFSRPITLNIVIQSVFATLAHVYHFDKNKFCESKCRL